MVLRRTDTDHPSSQVCERAFAKGAYDAVSHSFEHFALRSPALGVMQMELISSQLVALGINSLP